MIFMKNSILNLRFVNVVSGIAVLISLLFSTTSFAQDPDAKGRVNPLTIPVDADTKGVVNSFTNVTLGNIWQVTECCGWSGTWTRRPNTNTFDATWRHTNGTSASDVIELKTWNRTTNEVTLYRKSMNGSYKAFYNASNRTLINGTTTWYPAGQTWSAIIR
jgi:hypothetical protein